MIAKGFRFGMILQLAVGPVCLFIFQTAVASGFLAGFSGVLGTVLIDGSEILLAILGVGAILQRSKKSRILLKYGGAMILVLFGVANILGAFGVTVLPSLSLGQSENVFWQTALLALSNPLTILFWAGVFAAKIVEEDMERGDLNRFGFGCVLSTLFFLSLVSILGAVSRIVLPSFLITILNIVVGCVMILFGVKNAVKKD